MLFGRKKKKAQTDEEILQEAFAEVKGQQTKRETRKRRSYLWRKYADPRILVGLALIFVIIIADAVRRENMEFYATATQVSGNPLVRASESAPIETLEEGMRLEDGAEISTRQQGWVALSFPDGSVVTLAPQSHFRVRLLEYHRGGQWRSRAFTLLAGRMWARVSKKFGPESRCKIHTPSSVAAVRGTKFYVMYDPASKTTQIACNEGAVRVDGFRGKPATIAAGAETTCSYGAPPAGRKQLQPDLAQSFGLPPLNQEIKPDPWLKTMELKLTSILDLPLTILGIGKCSWAVGAADFARRTTAMEALRRIHTSIEGYSSYPEFVDPYTFAELAFRPEDALRVLKNFDGAALVKYDKVGDGFVMYARARDRNRTPFRLTQYGVEQISENEMP
ncbi:MAG: FecR domain-containing protein [Armatimonadetes bacterium]|nr:FecR domain-containing protein [Armatimonadota bacterium]